MLASAKTMKGALPPASKDTLNTKKRQVQGVRKTRKKEIKKLGSENKLLQSTCRHFVQQLRNRCRPGEADFFDDFIFAHFFTDFKNIFLGCDDIDDTIRNTCATAELLFNMLSTGFSEQGIHGNKSHLCESKGREWSLRWWFDDCSTSCSEGCAKFSCNHSRREIPWCQDGAVCENR